MQTKREFTAIKSNSDKCEIKQPSQALTLTFDFLWQNNCEYNRICYCNKDMGQNHCDVLRNTILHFGYSFVSYQ